MVEVARVSGFSGVLKWEGGERGRNFPFSSLAPSPSRQADDQVMVEVNSPFCIKGCSHSISTLSRGEGMVT